MVWATGFMIASAKIGFRARTSEGGWRYDPTPLTIRDGEKPLWTRHPDRDVAAMVIEAPPEFARAAMALRAHTGIHLGPGARARLRLL